MKLTAILLLTACLQVSANTYSQVITLNFQNTSLDKVVKEIERQTKVNFFYEEGLFKNAKPVTISVSKSTLEEALEVSFKNQPFDYKIVGKTVFIRKKSIQLTDEENKEPLIDIRGRVLNDKGEPVLASISVKGSTKGTTTNKDGWFALAGIEENAILIISGVSIETIEVKADGKKQLEITVKISVRPLDEVQMIAYGTTTNRLSTGNVSSVRASELEKQPVNNPLFALEGRVPGLFVTQSTGYPGSAATVQIRGKNSMLNGTNPLFVIDGVPYTSQLLPNLNSALGYSYGGGANSPGNYGNPLNYLNPSDIESIEILKDADATSIYGSRAANGAILITTKKGKVGQTKLNINAQSGWGKVNKKIKLLTTPQYLEMRREALANDNIPISSTDYDINGIWDTTQYTDWQKVLIGGTAKYSDVQASFSGGTTSTQFVFGGGFHRETSVFPSSLDDQKGSVHFNLNNNSVNNKFHLQLTGSYLFDLNKLPPVDLTSQALSLPPDAPAVYNIDGSLNWALPDPNVLSFGSWSNPLAALDNIFTGRTKNLISNALMSYQLIKGLYIKSNFGYTDMKVKELSYHPSTFFDPYFFSIPGNNPRNASYANNDINSWIVEPQITYLLNTDKGKIESLIGATINQVNREGEIIDGSIYANDLLLSDVRSASSRTVRYTENSNYKYNAVFGRINYNFKDKYLVNLTGRRDGSSRFGPANRFHNFWSIGTAWIFSDEKFVRENLSILSFGKLRSSYGTTGNDQIGDYQFMDLYNSISSGNPYLGVNGLIVNNLFNSSLQWEETKKFEAGVKLGFFKDIILLDINYFRNRSSNQLLNLKLPQVSGFTSIPGNLPATVQNSGVELAINTINVKSSKFSWSTSINVTIPKNKLVSFKDFANSPYNQIYKVGSPITETPLYHAEVDPSTGIYKFSDGKDSLVFDPSTATNPFIKRIDLAPKLYGGIQNSIKFGNLELEFLFQFVKQTGPDYFYGFFPGYAFSNQPASITSGTWKKVGDASKFQRLSSSASANVNGFTYIDAWGNTYLSDLIYSDASFIRLKNVSLSWHIPQSWVTKAKIQSCSVYMHAQNIWTITKYRGLDPETQTSSSLPILRVITLGVNLTL